MNRREVISAFGIVTFGMVIERTSSTLDHQPFENRMDARQLPGGPLPATVAGVRLVDSKVAKEATELSRTVSPPYLFNHAIRTYLFASLVGRSLAQTFDAELLYLACIFHDLGLTDKYAGDLPSKFKEPRLLSVFWKSMHMTKRKSVSYGTGLQCTLSPLGTTSNQRLRWWVRARVPMCLDLIPRRSAMLRLTRWLKRFPG